MSRLLGGCSEAVRSLEGARSGSSGVVCRRPVDKVRLAQLRMKGCSSEDSDARWKGSLDAGFVRRSARAKRAPAGGLPVGVWYYGIMGRCNRPSV